MKASIGASLPYGVWKMESRMNFTVESEETASCFLLLYRKGEETPCETFPMTKREGRLFSVALEDFSEQGYEYNFLIDEEVVLDPYAKKILGREGWNDKKEKTPHQIRCGFLEIYDWEGDGLPTLPSEEVISYGLHVRGFTKDKSSKVKQGGTFQGIIEKIPYLLELGINQVHLLPIYEFEERTTPINYWGYGDAFFFAPKSAYSSTGDGTTGLKDLVKELHKHQIEIILEFPFPKELSPEYALNCLRFYAMEYHIDGFLVEEWNLPIAWIEKDPILGSRKLLQRQTEVTKTVRKFLKGDEGQIEPMMHWMKSNGKGRGFYQITTHNGYTLQDLVSYEKKHNEENGEQNRDGEEHNFSWNCGIEGETKKKSILDIRKRQMRNAHFLLFLLQDTPFLLSGDEFCNTQKGNNNPYCQDNPVSWLSWNFGKRQKEMLEFVKDLIGLRKKYKILAQGKPLSSLERAVNGLPEISFHGEGAWKISTELENRQMGVLYSGRTKEEESCFVAYNMHWIPHSIALPKLPFQKRWYLVADTDHGVLREVEEAENQRGILLEGRSVAVFVAR